MPTDRQIDKYKQYDKQYPTCPLDVCTSLDESICYCVRKSCYYTDIYIYWAFSIISFWLKKHSVLEDGSASIIR